MTPIELHVQKMDAYKWSKIDEKSKLGFDSLFTTCRALNMGFDGNREKTKCTVSYKGLHKVFLFD